MLEQVSIFKPKIVSIKDSNSFVKFKNKNALNNLKILNGNDSFDDILDFETDIVVAAITGSAGLLPVVGAAKRGITIALANRKSCMFWFISDFNSKKWINDSSVDSEHNAIYQVLDLKNKDKVSKLILTASGGPFLNKSLDELKNITPDEAIKHPNWSMGKKISVDSATMMNKGLELIEAHYLFDMPHDKIDILVHPESIIHSCVEYSDGSILAQMGNPDMRTPISYTLAYQVEYLQK